MKYPTSFLLLLLFFLSCKHEPMVNPDFEHIGETDFSHWFWL